ncbi:MAG: hypothetical protein FIA92_00535 [Chloroflexi bacterium]|nr:hypothetical protein [Chloroflexota bacterium]
MTGITANPELAPGLDAPVELPEDVQQEGGPGGPTAEDYDESRRRRRWIALLALLGLLLVLIGLALWYFIFRQPLPLPIPTTIDLPGYSTSFYGAANPLGIAVSPDGDRVYVAQTEGDRAVLIYAAGGAIVGTAVPPTSTGTDHVPVWMAIDPMSSELYVSDRPMGTIYVYDRDGAFLREVVLASRIPAWQPMGLAFDAAGNLYVSDLSGPTARVEKFDRGLTLVQTFGESDRLSFPNGVAIDKDGNVLVADSNNGRLLAYRADGTLLAQVGRGTGKGALALPRGLTTDGRDRIYVGDSTGQGVLVYRLTDDVTPTLEYLGFFGGEGIADGRFSFPNGVAADGRGRLYVSDTNNDRVQLWSY